MITCCNVFNVWPKTTLLLPVRPRDAKSKDTPGIAWRCWMKGRVTCWGGGGGTKWDLQDFITLLRTVSNLKLVNCLFLELPIEYFQSRVEHVSL